MDLETLPLMAFHTRIAERMTHPAGRLWLRLQAFLFMPLSCLLVATGWQFVLHPRHMLRSKKYDELVAVVVRLALIFGVVLRDHGVASTLGIYCFYNFVGAAYIFTNFALSHTHLPVTNPNEFLHWVEYASHHTTNIAPGWICNWWMGYLNFQIEHHLFPSMPQFRHPHISPRVRALFEKHGLDYDVRGYFSCLRDTLVNLHQVGNHVKAA